MGKWVLINLMYSVELIILLVISPTIDKLFEI
jgi:hypothetical protein